MEYKDIADLSQTQLREHEIALRRELAMLVFEKASGKVLDTAAPKKKRVELARVLTRMTQLERNS